MTLLGFLVALSDPSTADPFFWSGVDISHLSTEDAAGAKLLFRKEAGGAKEDAMKILRQQGVNAFRMRVWNDPTE
jgi:arabinogalactan endo-1,4-beta-galactosidase